MSIKLDDIVDNLSEANSWIRILLMVVFAAMLYIILAPVILVMMISQGLFSLITGDNNSNLRMLGGSLNKYAFQILQFISYNSEDRPFPFSGFPDAEDQNNEKSDSKVEEVLGVGLVANAEVPADAKKGKKKTVKTVAKKSGKKKAVTSKKTFEKSTSKKTGRRN